MIVDHPSDCRVCNRRRIKCDRRLPTCGKCEKKGLACPGYGLRLQWGHGVASRGKLAGRAVPISDTSDSEPGPSRARSDTNDSSILTPPSSSPELSPQVALVRAVEHKTTSHNDYSKSRGFSFANLSLSPLPSHLQDKSTQYLVQYFDNAVAGTLQWVDSPNSPWRVHMLPLSVQSPSLLLSILALAAEHLTARMGDSWSGGKAILSRDYRGKCLALLAEDLRAEASGKRHVEIEQSRANATLATVLTLCHSEMVQSSSALWRVHWHAARTIIRRWVMSRDLRANPNPTTGFLIDEAFVIDVFAATTTFDDDGEIPGSLIAAEDRNVFTDYLLLIQGITRAERTAHSASNGVAFNQVYHDLQRLREKLDHTRNRSIHFSKSIQFGSDSLRANFLVIIDIYHHAGMIYGCQAMHGAAETAGIRSCSLRQLMAAFTTLDDNRALQQDVVWPLFIAGTESRWDLEKQSFILQKMQVAMHSTGFLNCVPAIQFLQRFWTTDPLAVQDWMDFARNEAKQGVSFVVI